MANNPTIEKILERQARSWELRSRIADKGETAARDALLHLSEGPWISISRQLGVGGLELAQFVASEMNWQVFDREILSAIAENTSSREAVLARLDEQKTTPFRDYVSHLFVPGEPGRPGYMQQMTQVILSLAKNGQAVILGRGANWFLDPRFGLRVRVVAPLGARVERVSQVEKLRGFDAERKVLQHDKAQQEFIREYFGRDINDPQGYDLVINAASLGQEASARIVLDAVRGKLG